MAAEETNSTHRPGLAWKWRRRLVLLIKYSVRLCLVVLLLTAAVLTSGRLLMPLVSGQKAAMERELGELLGTGITIDELKGDWFRYAPTFDVTNLQIIPPDNPDTPLVISRLSIRPALLDSILSRSLVIDQVIVQEPDIELRQDANGKWMLAGMTGGEGDYTDAIVDFLFDTGRMQITEADLAMYFTDGRELDLDNIYIDLGNEVGVHRFQAQARIAGQPSPFQLQFELNGDPRDRFTGSGYLHVNQMELSDLVSIRGLELESAQLSGDIWVNVQQGLLYDLQASLQDVFLEGRGTGENSINNLAMENGSLQATLRHESDNHWRGWLDGVEFDWQNRPWSTDQVFFDFRNDPDSRPLEITARSVDLAMVNDIIDDLFSLSEFNAGVSRDLSPRGNLENMKLTTDLNGEFEGGFLFQGNLKDVAVDAWSGAPAAQGISGYIQANGDSGFVDLDSNALDMRFPDLFENDWSFDSVTSTVRWQIDEYGTRVNSSVIDARNDYLHGHVQFDLYSHKDSSGEEEAELTLLVGILSMDAGYKSLFLPTLPIIRDTKNWLDDALLAGDLTESGFISRNSIVRNSPQNSGTAMSFYHIENGRLKFLPNWPELYGVNADVMVNNDHSDVTAETASIEGIILDDIKAAVRPNPAGGALVSITGGAVTSTDLGLAFLRNTPVRNNIGSFIDDWEGEGNINVDIDLGIPLNNPSLATNVLVNVVSDLSTLRIPEYSLSIDEIRGRIVYDSDKGLSANALSGKLFDFPIAATIEPTTTREPADVEDSDGSSQITGTRIVGSGRASKSALQEWQGQPAFIKDVLNFASGQTDYLAEVTIPNVNASQTPENGTRLRLSSELLGLSLDLPPPFGKTVDNIRPLELLINFTDTGEWISASFDNSAGTNLRITGDRFVGGKVVFGQEEQQMVFGPVALENTGLNFTGNLSEYDYDAWDVVAQRFASFQEGRSGETQELKDLVNDVDVNIGKLSVIRQELENVHSRVRRGGSPDENGGISAEGSGQNWLVILENDLVGGSFLFPDDTEQPWTIDLDYLRLPESEEEETNSEEEVDILADVIPGELPPMNFTTDEFSIGDKHLGTWEFTLHPSGDSASISGLKMTTEDASIRDTSGETGANINWRYSDGTHTSSFTGLFSAGDLAKVLPGWGYNANVESRSAAFVSDLQWNGSPASFELDKVIGSVDVEIRNGRFVDVDAGGGRLIGVFNLDALVRRLQLDFSDLFKRGLAYDQIRGQLDFDRGIVRTHDNFVVNGPSSRITINGEIDMPNQTIDADLLVNVPLGQNLSVLAGILGAWPIALSTYVASKLFRDQMDEFTTVLYRLEGPWENPTSGFEPSEEILKAEPAVEGDEAPETAL